MKTFYALSIAVFTLIFSSCDETKKVIEVAETVQLTGEYSVMKVGKTAVKGSSMSISFTALDKSVKGDTGCNSYFGNYTLDAFALGFGDIAVSEKYCDEPIMKSERALLGALKNTGSFVVKDKVLTLYSKTDRSILLTAKKTTAE